MNHKRLFIPGPSEVRPEILQAMATPQIGHRSKEYTNLHTRCVEKLQTFFGTKEGNILIWTCSSSGIMEGAARNTCAKKCACFINGAFSKRWSQLIEANGIEIVKYNVDMGKAIKPEMVKEVLDANPDVDAITVVWNETSTGVMSPIPEIGAMMQKDYPNVMFLVDAVSAMAGIKIEPANLGIDVVLAGVQKAFALPAGLTISWVSDKAIKKAETIKFRGGYIDFIAQLARQKKNMQTPSTPSVAHMFALDKQLDFILAEGDARYERHLALAKRVRKYVEEKWEPYTEKGFESNTVTNIANNRGISIAKLNAALGKEYLVISNGYGELKEKCFRIAHMGDTQMWEIEGLLQAIERTIEKYGDELLPDKK
ncbi:alanine--glyoxylate aminotransferase family protein [bacterium]|nr:alanine--glyoxylate aminotransferase family protein [bacterium]